MSMRPDGLLLDRRAFLRGVAGTAGGLALGACTNRGADRAGRGSQGGRPTIRIQGGWFGWPSPFGYIAAPGYWRMSFIFDTLLWTDATGRLLPWLAANHERSDDGLVHTIELREASWHDGQPLTADDVVFTLDYFDSQLISPLSIASPRNIAEATATGERTVQIRLEHPDATFRELVLGTVPIIPEHVWADIEDAQSASGEQTVIGTGPYRLESSSEEQGRLLYVANDDFFLGRPVVERIEMVQVDDELVALRAGELDGAQAPAEGVRDEVIDPYRQDPAFGVIEHETAFAFPLYWNLERGGALADVRFRRACLMAIDRENILERLMTGNGTVGSPGFLPPEHPFAVEVERYPYDREAANRLLDEAGYQRPAPGEVRLGPDGEPFRFGLYTHNTVPPALPELVAADLGEVGIEVDQQVVDLVRLLGIKTEANYDMLIHFYPGPVGTMPTSDPNILQPVYHSEPPNQLFAVNGYANPEVDRLLEQQLRTYDDAERKRLVGEIQRIVARDLPIAVLYYTTMIFAFHEPTFDGWYYTDGGFGPGIPDAYNKHAFVTGQRTGLDIAPTTGAPATPS